MRSLMVVLGFLCVASFAALSQPSATRIAGVTEPPELTGPPKSPVHPTDADLQFAGALGAVKDEREMLARLPQLDKFIQDHPDYPDAYSFRAEIEACISDAPDLVRAKSDTEAAMSHPDGTVFDDQSHLSMLGKIAFANGEYKVALDDMDRAMQVNLSNADKIFNIEGVVPERTSKFCAWNLADLDSLATRFPRDWRPIALRGLYYQFFTTFKEEYYPNATADFQKAALIDPRSPVPPYLLGELHTKAAFWTKKAWASDAGRSDATRAAVLPYTTAIHLDPNFAPAYAARAEAYLELKQSELAVKDFDRVLALDPKNMTAYSDRGLAKWDLGRFYDAISDYGEAIRLKGDDDTYLPNLYENRADAYLKVNDVRSAIDDYSHALALLLQTQIQLLSLAQFRALYPEYSGVSDDTLLRKLNLLFDPQSEFSAFKTRLTEENGKWGVSLLNDLYEKRGDAYLQSDDFRRSILDFQRIYIGIPNFANSVERWRAFSSAGRGRYYLDVKSSEVSLDGQAKLWVKRVEAKQSEVMAFGINCKARQINQRSSITYGSNDEVLKSSDLDTGWADVIPDTIGEQLWAGACSNLR